MRICRIKEVVRYMWRHKIQEPLIIVGERGIGKTQTLKDLEPELSEPTPEAKAVEETVKNDLKAQCCILRIGSKNDVGDLLGMPYVTENRETRYAPPEWILSIQHGGILILDEINRAKPTLHDAIMNVLGERKFDTYKIPDNVVIVGIMNPTTEDYDVADFDAAMIDRGVFVKATIEPEDVIQYFMEHEYDPEILDILSLSKDRLQLGNGFNLPPKKFTPRGVRQLQAFWGAIKELPDCANELVLGCVGAEGFSAYNDRAILREIPTAEQYFKDPSSVDLAKIKPTHMLVFITRVMGFLRTKKATPELRTKFTALCANLSEQMLMYLARVSMETPWLNRFIETTNQKLNDASIKLVSILAQAE